MIRQINKDLISATLPRLEQRDYIGDAVGDDVSSIMNRITFAWEGDLFTRFARRTAEKFVLSSAKQTSRKLGIDAYKSPAMQRFISNKVAENVQLISSVASEHLNAVKNIVLRNVSLGIEPKAIESEIQAYGVSEARAKLIAQDQTTKILGAVSRLHQEQAGFKYFRWVCLDDERVRKSHHEAQERMTKFGKGVYSWDDLPIVDGEKAFPSSPIRCRCFAEPVPDYEVEEFMRKNK